jgi:hypothetical protein
MFALLRSPKSQSPWCTLDIARKPSMTRGSPRQFGNLPRVWELLNIAFFFLIEKNQEKFKEIGVMHSWYFERLCMSGIS